VPIDLQTARENARGINPRIEILELSCQTGAGLDGWRRWLQGRMETARQRVPA